MFINLDGFKCIFQTVKIIKLQLFILKLFRRTIFVFENVMGPFSKPLCQCRCICIGGVVTDLYANGASMVALSKTLPRRPKLFNLCMIKGQAHLALLVYFWLGQIDRQPQNLVYTGCG